MKKKRLFTGIPLPEIFLKELIAFQKKYAHLETVRWIQPANLHSTVFFIGEVSESVIPVITEKMEAIFSSAERFYLQFEQLCFFPEKKPRMIWAKFEKHEVFSDLSDKISHAINSIVALEKEEKETIPHCTLARFKFIQNPDKINFNFPVKNRIIEVKECVLWESLLNSAGAVYKPVRRFELRI